jgi:hypothetical protein
MNTGKGAVCNRLLVFPPGKLLAASLCNFRLVKFLSTKRAFAASNMEDKVAFPLLTLILMSATEAVEGETKEGAMVDEV